MLGLYDGVVWITHNYFGPTSVTITIPYNPGLIEYYKALVNSEDSFSI